MKVPLHVRQGAGPKGIRLRTLDNASDLFAVDDPRLHTLHGIVFTKNRQDAFQPTRPALHLLITLPVHQPLATSHARRAASLLRRSPSVVSPPPSGSQPGGWIT
jgi:hypothetical protein